jgi:acyl-CoA synthetase (AMP-forming)/AMP-acid ligase II
MLLHQYLFQSVKEFPDKEALVCGRERTTYAQLGSAATAFGSFLVSNGLEKGGRVVVFLDNSLQAVIALFGIWEAGGCCVVINPSTMPDRLGAILKNCEPKFLVCPVWKIDWVDRAMQDAQLQIRLLCTHIDEDSERCLSFNRILRDQRPVPGPMLDSQDLAAIIYTSGSTGRPKGVTHLHRTIDVAVESIKEYLENRSEDVILSVLALSASYGLLQLLVTFRTGGSLVLEKGFGYPYEIIKRIQDERVTGMAGAPTIWALILRLEGTDQRAFDSLRYITNAAAALPASFVPRLRARFPQTKIFLMHGLTECLRTTFLPPDEVESRPTSVGKGMRNVDLWIEDENRQRLGAGQVGEMIVQGPTIMAGYWNDPAETAKALIPGPIPDQKVLRTRDLFRMDEDGYFHFVARSDELIKSRGEKVSPVEVEDIIYTLDAVSEVRVLGIPDPILGNSIRAEIVLRDGKNLTAQDVKSHCRQFLEDFKVPQAILFVDSLPKTQGGKIKRSAEALSPG